MCTEFFFKLKYLWFIPKHNADYCIISLSLVHNICLLPNAQRLKGPSQRKFHTQSTKTELKVHAIMVNLMPCPATIALIILIFFIKMLDIYITNALNFTIKFGPRNIKLFALLMWLSDSFSSGNLFPDT
jgi:ABC-type nickel/cobalt efflux system permease component RcnA